MVMIYECEQGVYAFLYKSQDDIFASNDLWYESINDAEEEYVGETNEWILIDDPMPFCQHDSILPIRIKGREKNLPQWGNYEVYENGHWIDFISK